MGSCGMSATECQSWNFPPVDNSTEEEPILCTDASEALYKRAEPTRLLRYHRANEPPWRGGPVTKVSWQTQRMSHTLTHVSDNVQSSGPRWRRPE